MRGWPMLLANRVGFRWPTVEASRADRDAVMWRAERADIKQGGTDRRQLRYCVCQRIERWSAEFVVGLAVPPYGLPPTDPTPSGFARCSGQRRERGGHVPLARNALANRPGSAHADDEHALREFPLDPLPLRDATDRRPSRQRWTRFTPEAT